MKWKSLPTALVLGWALGSMKGTVFAQATTQHRVLTIDGARTAIAAIAAEAKRTGAPGAAVAVVDDGGNLIALERLEGTFTAAWRISIGKARTAAMFRKPTSAFEKIIKDGRTPMIALEDFTPLQGGVPVVVDGLVVGAIGVSGASSAQQDEDFAIVGAAAVSAAVSTAPADVVHLGAEKVQAAFARGGPLVEFGQGNYMVNASRRDTPGEAEVHHKDTDIFHVLSGSATFVTGGILSTPASPSADHEIRAAGIEGGQSRKISAGDVVVVPAGVPHWFREVHSPMTYYVVKVRS